MFYDALAEVEMVTGKHYKSSEETTLLGINLMHRSAEAQQRMLESSGDVYFGMPLVDYTKTITALGFDRVFSLPFECKEWNQKDELQVWWNDTAGSLLVFDTYCGDRLNNGKFYYNFLPNDKNDLVSGLTSSDMGKAIRRTLCVGR